MTGKNIFRLRLPFRNIVAIRGAFELATFNGKLVEFLDRPLAAILDCLASGCANAFLDDMSVIVAPSVLASDWGRLHEQIRQVEQAGADWLHLDVMDGHLVDNISFGPAFCECVARVATVPLDVHLMLTRPDHYWSRFAKLAHNITIHVESDCDIGATLAAIRTAGCKAGISLKPGTPMSRLEPFLGSVDIILMMTVEPGYGGQPFLPEMMEKVRTAEQRRRSSGFSYRIEVDGGINVKTAALSIEAGADTLVAGTSVFGAEDMAAAIRGLRP